MITIIILLMTKVLLIIVAISSIDIITNMHNYHRNVRELFRFKNVFLMESIDEDKNIMMVIN